MEADRSVPDDSGAGTGDPIGTFITRWDDTEQAERANYARFLNELCDVLAVPRPDPAAGPLGDYRYERGVNHSEANGASTTRRIDLYERGCFVLEAKQGANAPKQDNLFGAAEAERRANVRRSPGWAHLRGRSPRRPASRADAAAGAHARAARRCRSASGPTAGGRGTIGVVARGILRSPTLNPLGSRAPQREWSVTR